MPRYLVQSVDTGRFLVPTDHGPDWVARLDHACGGVIADWDEAGAMAVEYAEIGEAVIVVDLDRLGTAEGYE